MLQVIQKEAPKSKILTYSMIKQEDIQTHRYILTRDSTYPKDFVKVSAAGCPGPSSRYYTIPTFLKAHKDQLLIG